jgi:hypothetical protein
VAVVQSYNYALVMELNSLQIFSEVRTFLKAVYLNATAQGI